LWLWERRIFTYEFPVSCVSTETQLCTRYFTTNKSSEHGRFQIYDKSSETGKVLIYDKSSETGRFLI
jgi:hypothetical protein